jgi:putative ABC transport system substrate-binding protein
MRRRHFIAALCGTVAWPPALGAQQVERERRIAALMGIAEDAQGQAFAGALRGALQDRGWIEGRNLQIAWRWAGGDPARFREYAAELVGLAPEAILAVGTSAVAAPKQATRSIPIIFAIVNDPVAQGFISSMAHPGANITGFSFLEYSALSKSMEMLKQVAPEISRIALMFNPETYPYYTTFLRSSETSSHGTSIELTSGQVHSQTEIEDVIAELGAQRGSGLLVAPDPFTSSNRARSSNLRSATAFPRSIHFGNMSRKEP